MRRSYNLLIANKISKKKKADLIEALGAVRPHLLALNSEHLGGPIPTHNAKVVCFEYVEFARCDTSRFRL